MIGRAGLWLFVLAVAAVAVIEYRDDITRFLQSAGKPQAGSTERTVSGGNDREIRIERTAQGHFLLVGHVNGEPVRFLVDTGASMVALSRRDAVAAGLNLDNLDFNIPVQTANGIARAAKVELRELRIDQLSLYDVEASVVDAELGISLLGMTFLNRLNGFEVREDRLTLRW